MKMLYLLFIVFVLGTLLQIYMKQVSDFLDKYCGFERLYVIIGNLFVSQKEKEWSQKAHKAMSAPRKDLLAEYYDIIGKYAKKYPSHRQCKSELISTLPHEIQDFFQKYDYLQFPPHDKDNYDLYSGQKILDIKSLKVIHVCQINFVVLGYDKVEREFFAVKQETPIVESSEIYIFDMHLMSKDNVDEIYSPSCRTMSIVNFVCFMYSIMRENELT